MVIDDRNISPDETDAAQSCTRGCALPERTGRNGRSPVLHAGMRLTGAHLAKLRDDVRVDDIHQVNTAGRATSSEVGAVNSTSSTPSGSPRRSRTSAPRRPS